ncbi:MAG: phosphoglucosamine mutase [Pseudomonadota bacterium]|nr:phosphoglucosamine mutase [Pseudomonadota bacterium]
MAQRQYFGTDGIRGHVGETPITAEFALRLGNAAGRVLMQGTQRTVLIGKDTRLSGYMLEAGLQAGLIAAGANAQLLGPIPTPGVAHLVRQTGACAGIVISASHNPHHDNGFKFFSAAGEKLADSVEAAIEAALADSFCNALPDQLGKASRMLDAGARYLDFCRASVPADFRLHGMRVVLDCAHGATYKLAPQLFASLGAEVHCIGVAPDGLNINQECGSMHPQALQAALQEYRADIGIAFDGDGDRVMLVDATGELLDGDDLLHILGSVWKQSGRLRGPVVGTLMTNYALEKRLCEYGIAFERANVGDRFVHERLIALGGNLGGEASGHILCLDRAGTGDAMVSALQVLEAIQSSCRSAADWRAALPRFPQRTINVRIERGARPLAAASVQAERERIERWLHGRGRVVLRASGTEPVVRVTVEAERIEEVELLASGLAEAVSSAAR